MDNRATLRAKSYSSVSSPLRAVNANRRRVLQLAQLGRDPTVHATFAHKAITFHSIYAEHHQEIKSKAFFPPWTDLFHSLHLPNRVVLLRPTVHLCTHLSLVNALSTEMQAPGRRGQIESAKRVPRGPRERRTDQR